MITHSTKETRQQKEQWDESLRRNGGIEKRGNIGGLHKIGG